jgi:DNA-directed RNA polymerase specialized sigma24 family protein
MAGGDAARRSLRCYLFGITRNLTLRQIRIAEREAAQGEAAELETVWIYHDPASKRRSGRERSAALACADDIQSLLRFNTRK